MHEPVGLRAACERKQGEELTVGHDDDTETERPDVLDELVNVKAVVVLHSAMDVGHATHLGLERGRDGDEALEHGEDLGVGRVFWDLVS